MPDPDGAFSATASPCLLRQARAEDFTFAEALTHDNMCGYYQRHRLDWRSDLFFASWRESENFILEVEHAPVGVLRITEENGSLHIRDLQIAPVYRRQGVGTWLLHVAHQWARERGLQTLQLRVFVDNPAAALYRRMGYRPVGPRLAQLGVIWHMSRRV
ncbi:GNAT family N-acetyltransferase [Paraburkholderia bonniea]|uniref:GNAT family N-acetyltransferase n=1 Tax=Paraburkholderia bonniea TaxID=2152891 RepID=UPI001290C116|nr:GNAT family N-acetyltransferase [Paraburkholderia bonniea]WJF89240.1 GNAT family N-acetyltransferase [Paraburkholderia bonniea]WJF92556.1 GNAT family N-acetyltransferase [Paraburkholderia bonniea]